jgi:XTP/dITP diphosphohydrolase
VTLYCATGNAGKLREFRLAGERFAIETLPLPGLAAIPPCPEDGQTFEENAIRKATYYAAHAPGPLFADDSGLEVEALGGAPGVYSARFAGERATDAANNQVLLEKLHGIADRRARFVCVIALAEPGATAPRTFRGTVEGEILREPRGAHGFGYDPLFYFPPFGCSFGELAADRKFDISHRGQALTTLFAHLKERDRLQFGDA